MEAESSASTSTHDRGPASDNAELRTQSAWRSPVTCCHHRFMASSDALMCRRGIHGRFQKPGKSPTKFCINMPVLARASPSFPSFLRGAEEEWPAKQPFPPSYQPTNHRHGTLFSCASPFLSQFFCRVSNNTYQSKSPQRLPHSPPGIDSSSLSCLSKTDWQAGHPSLAPPTPRPFPPTHLFTIRPYLIPSTTKT